MLTSHQPTQVSRPQGKSRSVFRLEPGNGWTISQMSRVRETSAKLAILTPPSLLQNGSVQLSLGIALAVRFRNEVICRSGRVERSCAPSHMYMLHLAGNTETPRHSGVSSHRTIHESLEVTISLCSQPIKRKFLYSISAAPTDNPVSNSLHILESEFCAWGLSVIGMGFK